MTAVFLTGQLTVEELQCCDYVPGFQIAKGNMTTQTLAVSLKVDE